MSQSYSAYWLEIRERAIGKPKDRLDWLETIALPIVALALFWQAFGRGRAVEELTTTFLYIAAGLAVSGVFVVLRVGRAAFETHVDALKNIALIESRLSADLKIRRKDQAITDALLVFRERGIKLFHQKVKSIEDYDAWKELFRTFESDVSRRMRELKCSESEIHGFEQVGPVLSIHSEMDGAFSKADRNKGRLVAKLNHLGVVANQHDTTRPV